MRLNNKEMHILWRALLYYWENKDFGKDHELRHQTNVLRERFSDFMLGETTKEEESSVVWHDLRKNPEDVPPLEHKVIVMSPSGEITSSCRYYDDYSEYIEWERYPVGTPIAWCEIPKFEES